MASAGYKILCLAVFLAAAFPSLAEEKDPISVLLQTIEKEIPRLGSDRFDERERACSDIAKLLTGLDPDKDPDAAKRAVLRLREIENRSSDPEIQIRLHALIDPIDEDGGSAAIAWGEDLAKAKKKARARNKPILIYFGADWCPVCKRLNEGPMREKEVLERSRKFMPVGVNVNAPENKELMNRYGIKATPTLVFTDPEGREILRGAGGMESTRLLKLMDDALQKASEKPASK